MPHSQRYSAWGSGSTDMTITYPTRTREEAAESIAAAEAAWYRAEASFDAAWSEAGLPEPQTLTDLRATPELAALRDKADDAWERMIKAAEAK